jgi:hypothetical protein
MVFNRNAVVANFIRAMRNGRNRVAVGNGDWTMTQGSLADSATAGLWDGIPLGFGLAARWVRRDAAATGGNFFDKF